MSWKGVKKTFDRASTSLMQATGAVERTVDREFEDEEKRYRTLEAKVDKMHKEAKSYLDAVRAMTIAQQRISECINLFYDESAQFADAGIQYKNLANELDEQARTNMDRDYRQSVLEPLGSYAQVFPLANETIRRRQKKLLDYDSYRSKVRGLAEKPSADSDKLPKAEAKAQQAKGLYEEVNRQLIDDIPLLIDARVPILDPSFEALIKTQIKFAEDAYQQIHQLKQQFEYNGMGEPMEGRVDEVLQKLRDLQIVQIHNAH